MSHQTGITANEDLVAFFGKCRERGDQFRALKIVIRDERLALEESHETRGNWEEDWEELVVKSVDDNEPSYILFRLDEKDDVSGYKWIFISWSPDEASVRNKMLYASTKATLKMEFGSGRIADELYANVISDVTLAGYKRHCSSEEAPGPLSREEIEREEVRMAQANNVEVNVNSKHQTVGGLAFPMTDSSLNAIGEFRDKSVNYVQLSIDVQNEIINLEEKGTCSVQELPSKVPSQSPRYHLFNFKHAHEGDYQESSLFIYTMPGYNCPIKERMLYSSCRNAVVDVIESLEITISKKIEVETGEELVEDFLREELHPKKNLNRPKFARPAPPNRGHRRLTKNPAS